MSTAGRLMLFALGAALPVGCAFATGGLGAPGGGGAGAGPVASASSATASGGGAAVSGSGGSPSSTSTSTSTSASSSAASSGAGGCEPSPMTVCCREVPCAIGISHCCLDETTAPVGQTCLPLGQQCPGGQVDMTCDDAEDCPDAGSVCCGAWSGSEYQGSVACQGEANCVPPSVLDAPGVYPICDPDGGTCPPGRTCHLQAKLGPGHGFCF